MWLAVLKTFEVTDFGVYSLAKVTYFMTLVVVQKQTRKLELFISI